jgi:hypothetical protein
MIFVPAAIHHLHLNHNHHPNAAGILGEVPSSYACRHHNHQSIDCNIIIVIPSRDLDTALPTCQATSTFTRCRSRQPAASAAHIARQSG